VSDVMWAACAEGGSEPEEPGEVKQSGWRRGCNSDPENVTCSLPLREREESNTCSVL